MFAKSRVCPRLCRCKGNVIAQVVALASARRALAVADTAAAITVVGVIAISSGAATTDQRNISGELLEDDFGGVALLALLVGSIAGFDRALEVNFFALPDIFLDDFHEVFIPDSDPMPFGFFAFLVGGFIAPLF